jgi:putative transposase
MREELIMAAEEVAATVGIAPACRALGAARSSLYRHRQPAPEAAVQARRSYRALTDLERRNVLSVLHSERFIDQAPAEIYATLLDEGAYLCSARTMYRILAEQHEVRERRDQLRHPHYAKPELLATAPNQIWSWDITKLLGPGFSTGRSRLYPSSGIFTGIKLSPCSSIHLSV